MIDYIIPENPDDRVLKKACELLRSGKTICLPTDTSWVLLVDPYIKDAIKSIYQLKGETHSKHFSLLCRDFSMASEIAVITDSAYRTLRNKIPGHYTFIFESTKKISKALKASKTDKEVGLRFIPLSFVNQLIDLYGQVLASTNITHDMLNLNEGDEIYSFIIEENLGQHLSQIIDPGEYHFAGVSTIYRFINDEMELIREGSGELI